MATIKLKDLLLENPDTLILKKPDGTNRYIGYGGPNNAATGLIFSDPIAGTAKNYVVLVDDEKIGEKAVVQLQDQELNAKAVNFLSNPSRVRDVYSYEVKERIIINDFASGEKGHGSLESFISFMFGHLYGGTGDDEAVSPKTYDHYDETWRFRIFHVDGKRYFTIWQGVVELYKNQLPLFVKIVKDCGFDPNEMMWEVRTNDPNDRFKLVSMEGLHKLMGTEKDSPETQSEIQKRISELSKKLAEMESDEHVKGATWSESEKRRHKIEMINIKAELEALSSASKSGEKEIKNVVIKTIDSLEDSEGEIIPADILYAELEKKLSRYGTSAVAIMRSLRDKGIDIKKALREMNEKFGGKATATEILSELSKYTNKTDKHPTVVNEDDNLSLVQPGAISRFKETASTPEEFLKLFKGHTLKELLDKVSFCRLYVMNKFDDMRGDDPQQRFVWMLDSAITYINYRLIAPQRKKVDDEEAEDNARPEIIAYKKKRMEILKQSFAARRDGDEDRAAKLRSLYNDMEEPQMSRYNDNMKTMDMNVKKIHSTPLSLEDVTPSPNDSDRDKKGYAHFVEAFNRFKGN